MVLPYIVDPPFLTKVGCHLRFAGHGSIGVLDTELTVRVSLAPHVPLNICVKARLSRYWKHTFSNRTAQDAVSPKFHD